MMVAPKAESRQPTAARSFTLTELLAAMAIIAIIAGVTAISVRTIARDAKLSSANNTIAAALDTARGIAIRDNRLTVLVFRPRLDGNRQYVELVTAQWTGESPLLNTTGVDKPRVIDRFVPVPGLASRRLPVGMKVAGPRSHSNMDDVWTTQTHLPARPSEAALRLIGVMFAPNGTIVTRNASSGTDRIFVDFNSDGFQQISEELCSMCGGQIDYADPPTNIPDFPVYSAMMMLIAEPNDEPFVTMVPYLAVFNDDVFRDHYDTSPWSDFEELEADLTEFVTNHADRIHFNRYTGVVMR